MFNNCEFIIGKDKSLVVMVPQAVPKGESLTMRIVDDVVSFYNSDDMMFGRVVCACAKTLRCLRKKQRVGLIEAIDGRPNFPIYIAATARIEMPPAADAMIEAQAA